LVTQSGFVGSPSICVRYEPPAAVKPALARATRPVAYEVAHPIWTLPGLASSLWTTTQTPAHDDGVDAGAE
jgi:hypothetical protein